MNKSKRTRHFHIQGSALYGKKFTAQAQAAKDAFIAWIQNSIDDPARWLVTYRGGFVWLDDVDLDAQSSHGASIAKCEACEGDYTEIFRMLSECQIAYD